MRRLVVLGDSLSFHGPEGPLPLRDQRLLPTATKERLEAATGEPWEMLFVGRAGWSTRELALAVQKDPHLQQQVLHHADAVVLALGGADYLPVGYPRVLWLSLAHLRPDWLRRRLRHRLHLAHPHLVRLTGERMRYTPRSVHRRSLRLCMQAVRLLTPDGAVCALLPPLHVGSYYRSSLRHHADAVADTAEAAAEFAIPTVDMAGLMRPHLDRMNPDGIHWAYEIHAAAADAAAALLVDQLQAPPAAPHASAIR
jgi:diglucosylglycerate octanoyltransferase